MSKITLAIIPVAGLGTRFLPATKAQPKEMLTVVDKPVIQYIVEEAAASGIKDIIFITSHNKRAIEDHFDRNFELEYRLKKSRKTQDLKAVKDISKLANFIYIRQKSPRGWGDAILAAEHVIGNQPFAYFSGDDIIHGHRPAMKQLMNVYEKYGDGVIGVHKFPKQEISNYGVIDPIKLEERVYQIKSIVEKPKPDKAPSLLGVSGRYIFTPEIFSALKKTPLDKKGELVGTDAIKLLLAKKPFYACEFEGEYYDCGNKLEYLKAQVKLGLTHPELSGELKKFIRKLQV